jgi:isoquinoline 1-oxidoreductase alpha subunit
MITVTINGQDYEVAVPAEMPLLWVLRDVIGLTGTKFGCGIAQCGACTVHVDGQAVRSCVLPVAALVGRAVTTIEAIGKIPAGKRIQDAWLDIEVVQCGYCQSGQIMSAAALLTHIPDPSDEYRATRRRGPRGTEVTRRISSPRKFAGTAVIRSWITKASSKSTWRCCTRRGGTEVPRFRRQNGRYRRNLVTLMRRGECWLTTQLSRSRRI